MKYLKMLALAAMACTALMAFASTASATTLTAGGKVLPTGTVIHAVTSSAVLEDTTGLIQNKCESTVEGKTGSETGTSISGAISSLTWTNCTRPTKTLKNGSLSIKWTTGRNGTVTGSGTEVETEIAGGAVCVYGTGEGTTLGTLEGVASTTEKAKLVINTIVKLIKTVSGTCVSSARWTATYTVDNPAGLTVQN